MADAMQLSKGGGGFTLLSLSEIKRVTCIHYKHTTNTIFGAFVYLPLYQTR